VQDPEETDAASMARILRMPGDAIQRKKAAIAALRDRLMSESRDKSKVLLQSIA
jgi:hypothetical protein